MYPAYCHMSNLSEKCGGGGWTLVMKLDGDKVKNFIRNNLQVLHFVLTVSNLLDKKLINAMIWILLESLNFNNNAKMKIQFWWQGLMVFRKYLFQLLI